MMRIRLRLTVLLKGLARAAIVFLAYAAVFLSYLRLRNYARPDVPIPFSWEHLIQFEFREFDIGLFLQLIIVPVLLIYLLAYMPYFRRRLQDQTILHSAFGLFLGLAAVQLLSQSYDFWGINRLREPLHMGFLVILIGSLLGGWRIGIPLGVISMIFQGFCELLNLPHIITDVQNLGLWRFLTGLDWGPFLYTRFAAPHYTGGIWVAALVCLSADFLGKHRYSPFAAGILGAVSVFAAGYLQIAAAAPVSIPNLPTQALVAGLAAAWVMLMIRNLQVEGVQKRAAEAELSRMQAELRALRAQINPHFFFNALNTIRYMIRTDPPKARELLIDLSEVFQRTLRSGDFVPMRDELSSVEAYLSLEKARLGDRLRIVWGGLLRPDKPLDTESALLDQPVPTLALQPIVENAVIHGIGKKVEGGTVTILLERRKNDLAIIVEDDGMGMDSGRLAELLAPAGENHASIGVKNVDKRLRMLYGPEYRLAVESEAGKGTRVTIRIPIGKIEEQSRSGSSA